jgi:hypothetical protein
MPLVLKKISEELVRMLKIEAVKRGVSPSRIVEEALELYFKLKDKSVVEDEDLDDMVWRNQRQELIKKYRGKYVVIAGGRVIGAYSDPYELAGRIRELKKIYRRIVVVKPGIDEKRVMEWLGGAIEFMK